MKSKKVITLLTALGIVSAGVIPTTTTLAAEKEPTKQAELKTSNSLTLGELNSSYKVSNYEQNGLIRTVTYVNENGTEKHVVVYNGENGKITIDNITQVGLSYEYDPSLATTNNSSSSQITTMVAKPKSGYEYVGSISGNTNSAKGAAALAVSLASTIPGLGWSAKAVSIVTGYAINENIPKLYYRYDLYQKGFMTDHWYQYTITHMYKDKAHKKPTGKAWTSKPEKIDLPNS
ncbi:hypothetical protein [Heyndrickxia ginsengihumi]|uniref:hypothetical protein n=1 Tax=Heyndrickxia ginsengihumi TaxID=363870 RepID=UPI003D1C9602